MYIQRKPKGIPVGYEALIAGKVYFVDGNYYICSRGDGSVQPFFVNLENGNVLNYSITAKCCRDNKAYFVDAAKLVTE